MAGGPFSTFLDLGAGPFRLALSADHILGVVHEAGPPVSLRGEEFAFCDLAVLFAGTQRDRAPFAVCFEAGDQRVAIGVDRVDHLRVQGGTSILAIPPFGLRRPELFAGAIRDPDGLLLVLSPDQLVELTAPK